MPKRASTQSVNKALNKQLGEFKKAAEKLRPEFEQGLQTLEQSRSLVALVRDTYKDMVRVHGEQGLERYRIAQNDLMEVLGDVLSAMDADLSVLEKRSDAPLNGQYFLDKGARKLSANLHNLGTQEVRNLFACARKETEQLPADLEQQAKALHSCYDALENRCEQLRKMTPKVDAFVQALPEKMGNWAEMPR